jgi:NAD(P)-dependent dehydrogenase (short-subunit alcohol dehydrogenase family)
MKKHAIVTGGSAGIGLAVARELARRGFALTLLSSNPMRLEKTRGLIAQETGIEAKTLSVDFANLDAVFAASSSLVTGWDVLINNAGIKIQTDAAVSAQGHERHMAVNHLAHFALTQGLLRSANEGARIVSVASFMARFAPRELFEADALSTSQRYAASKLANLAFALELDSRLAASGRSIRSVAAHPGFTRAEPYGTRVTRLGEYLLAQNTTWGAKPLVAAATAADPSAYTGPAIAELWGSPKTASMNPLALDPKWRSDFWAKSEALTGIDFRL